MDELRPVLWLGRGMWLSRTVALQTFSPLSLPSPPPQTRTSNPVFLSLHRTTYRICFFFCSYNHWSTSWSPLHGSVHHIRPNIFSRLHSQQLEKSGIFLVNTTENRPPPVPRKSSRPPRSTGHKDRPAMPPRWTRPPRPSSISTRRAWSIPASTP